MTGRFTGVDPLMGTDTALTDPQRWNRYTYVGNRPTRVVDPDGRGWLAVVVKVAKVAVKGGSLAAEFQGVVDDAKTLFGSDASLLERGLAAVSLASEVFSPVSINDGKGAVKWAAMHADEGSDAVRAASRIETATGAASSLAEQLAIKEALAGAGERIMQGKVKDPRYPEAIWAKMEHVHKAKDGTRTVVHYWLNLETGGTEGFKIK